MKFRALTAKNIITTATVAGSLLALKNYGQAFLGWLARPEIEAAQARGLAHLDSLQQLRDRAHMDSLKAWINLAVAPVVATQEEIKSTLADVPAVRDAAKRRRARKKERDELFGARGIGESRITLRCPRPERVP